jgi:hypothetical protein
MSKSFTVANRNGWRIVINGLPGLQYPTQEAAVEAAIVRAQLSDSSGGPAEVLLEQPDGQLKRIWHSGE